MRSTLTKIKGWSAKKGKDVDWDINLVDEEESYEHENPDGSKEIIKTGVKHQVLLLTNGDEVHRLSPNSTDNDIKKIVYGFAPKTKEDWE